MAYSEANPPALKTQRVGAGMPVGSSNNGSVQAGATWYYTSVDTAVTVNGAGYITNGDDLGMKVGDIVEIFDTTTPALTFSWVDAVAADGAAELTAVA